MEARSMKTTCKLEDEEQRRLALRFSDNCLHFEVSFAQGAVAVDSHTRGAT